MRKELCRNFQRGSCTYGARCKFLHSSPQQQNGGGGFGFQQQQNGGGGFGFGGQAGFQQQQQSPNPFGFGVKSNSHLGGAAASGPQRDRSKPFSNQWTRNAATPSSRQADSQSQSANHTCTDPNSLKDINNRKNVICDFCGKITSGGITRAKRHQMGIKGDVNACTKTPNDVKAALKEAMEKKQGLKEYIAQEVDDEEEDVAMISEMRKGKRSLSEDSLSNARGSKNVKGPMDKLLYRNPETTLRLQKDTRQTSMNEVVQKEMRDKVVQYIARCFCRNGIAFNVVRSKSFKLMVEAIGNYGKHLKPPSFHEMRVPLLKKELEYTKELLKDHEEEMVNYGCSIMSDAWTDRKGRVLLNFLVNSPSGSMFVRSIDASSYMKTGEQVFKLLDGFVEEMGEKNVVQVITDNGSNYVLAGKFLEAKRTHLFWTPCTAHCLDLMLEDIGKIPKVKKAIGRAISLVGFVYNHSLVLNMMRKFTSKMELVRHGVTRFATSYLTLQRLCTQKSNLRKIFTSDEWLKSKLAKDRKGKVATDTVLMPSFWKDVVFTLKAMRPLVRVLRLVDNEKKPPMGYIYEAMDRAKEAIEKAFNGHQELYKDVFEIIDRRWECQLHHPLHAAGHYLNPEFFYYNPRIDSDHEVVEGLHRCIERLSENDAIVDKITSQLAIYKRASGLFSMKSAIRLRSKMAPAEWWRTYGTHVPELQKLAIKILSLTCSSSGCERNWSTFEHIHSKKRNRLEHQKLQDLVYIKYNQALKERFDCRDMIDPIVLDDVDDSNEWLVGEMGGDGDEFVFDDNDDLTWLDVANATGAGEPSTYTRQQTRLRTSMPTSSSGRGLGVEVREEDNAQVEEEEEEFYMSEAEDDDGGNEDLGVFEDDD